MVGLIENRPALGGAKQERAAAEIVDSAGDALGVVVDAADEGVAEQRALKASHT